MLVLLPRRPENFEPPPGRAPEDRTQEHSPLRTQEQEPENRLAMWVVCTYQVQQQLHPFYHLWKIFTESSLAWMTQPGLNLVQLTGRSSFCMWSLGGDIISPLASPAAGQPSFHHSPLN